MSAPVPATIKSQVGSVLLSFFEAPPTQEQLADAEDLIRRFAKANVAQGYLALAVLSMFKGDYDAMRRQYGIAKQQGSLVAGERLNYAFALAHVGFFSEAYALVDALALDVKDDMRFAARVSMKCLCFKKACDVFGLMESMQLNEALEALREEREMAFARAEMQDRIQIDDRQLAEIADVAGSLLRERGVRDDGTVMRTSILDNGEPCLIFTFCVPVDTEAAADLNWELAGRLVRSPLSLIEGRKVFVRFRGVEH